jgi:WD40 repeat protein
LLFCTLCSVMNLQVLSKILRWIIIVNQVWDYQTKSCVQTLEGHTHNVSAVCFHPELPIIVTGSEDGTVRIWHSTTYRLLSILYWRANSASAFPNFCAWIV